MLNKCLLLLIKIAFLPLKHFQKSKSNISAFYLTFFFNLFTAPRRLHLLTSLKFNFPLCKGKITAPVWLRVAIRYMTYPCVSAPSPGKAWASALDHFSVIALGFLSLGHVNCIILSWGPVPSLEITGKTGSATKCVLWILRVWVAIEKNLYFT